MRIKNIILIIWQFPQEIIGFILSRIWKKELDLVSDETISNVKSTEQNHGVKIYIVSKISHKEHKILGFISGFSIGRYICLNNQHSELTVKHELGHCIQSRLLGPVYLLIVGIPSAFLNILSRRIHATWTHEKQMLWYYSKYPENWADRLGGVERIK